MRPTLSLIVNTSAFLLGFNLMFTLISLGTIGVFRLLNLKTLRPVLGGAVVILGILNMLGIEIFNPGQGLRERSAVKLGKLITAFITGLGFGTVWTPCAGPILVAILALIGIQESFLKGLVMLLSFLLGIDICIMLSALFLVPVKSLIMRFSTKLSVMNIISGLLIIAVGVWIIVGLDVIPKFGINLSENFTGSLSVSLAFLAGVLSFLSPCTLPLIPTTLIAIAGISLSELSKPSLSEGEKVKIELKF